nr:MAG TPA: hypothetical protein [Myoviridae sp. ctTS62]
MYQNLKISALRGDFFIGKIYYNNRQKLRFGYCVLG